MICQKNILIIPAKIYKLTHFSLRIRAPKSSFQTPIAMNQDELKRSVATAAIEYVTPKLSTNEYLGIGTGSTANFFIDMLGPLKDRFKGAIASSDASAERLVAQGIHVVNLNQVTHISLYIDGADEINPQLACIKGGGAALTREKIVAACAQEFVCIADSSKQVDTLGNFPLPVEVIPMAREYVARELKKLGGTPVFREGVLTDNHCHILDVKDLQIHAPKELESTINQISGVVTNGLFALAPADVLLLGTTGGVKTIFK